MGALRGANQTALIFALLVFWGCDVTGEPQSRRAISVASEQKQYTLGPDAQVDFTVANPSNRMLYLPVCGPDLTFVLERRADGAWESYSGGLCPAIYAMGYRRILDPGASFRITTRIGEAGRYRVRLSYKTSRQAEEPEVVRSNTFFVRARS